MNLPTIVVVILTTLTMITLRIVTSFGRAMSTAIGIRTHQYWETGLCLAMRRRHMCLHPNPYRFFISFSSLVHFFCTGTALTRRQSLSETVTSPPQNGPQIHVRAGAMHHKTTRLAPHTLQQATLQRAICFGRDIVQQVTLSLASPCDN